MPEPGTDMAPGRRWRYVPRELVAVIVLQLAGAGAGVAAALAAGSAGPARAPGAAVAGMAGPQEAGVRWLVLAGAVALVLAMPVAAWWLIGDRYSSLSPGAEYLPRPGLTSARLHRLERPWPAVGRAVAKITIRNASRSGRTAPNRLSGI